MIITLADYYMGRDETYARDFTPIIAANAEITVERVNMLLEVFYAAQPEGFYRTVTSGWRPPEINAVTRGAAPNSKHLIGQACDLSDDDEALDNWLLMNDGQAAMERIGLWQESPIRTLRWAHLQWVPPASGQRTFMP